MDIKLAPRLQKGAGSTKIGSRTIESCRVEEMLALTDESYSVDSETSHGNVELDKMDCFGVTDVLLVQSTDKQRSQRAISYLRHTLVEFEANELEETVQTYPKSPFPINEVQITEERSNLSPDGKKSKRQVGNSREVIDESHYRIASMTNAKKMHSSSSRKLQAIRLDEQVSTELKSVLETKKSPTAKQPVRIFGSGEIMMPSSRKDTPNSPKGLQDVVALNKRNFMSLTIDIDEANKSGSLSLLPPKLGKSISPKLTTKPDSQFTSKAPANHIQQLPIKNPEQQLTQPLDAMKQFFQEQLDKLTAKNETLLRENERLRNELARADEIKKENSNLKAQLLELKQKPTRGGQFHLSDLKPESRNSREKLEIASQVHSIDPHDEYLYGAPKFSSENVSIEIHEDYSYYEKEESNLQDYIDRLRQSIEEVNRPTAGNAHRTQGSGHKKAASLASANANPKELKAYYQMKNKYQMIQAGSIAKVGPAKGKQHAGAGGFDREIRGKAHQEGCSGREKVNSQRRLNQDSHTKSKPETAEQSLEGQESWLLRKKFEETPQTSQITGEIKKEKSQKVLKAGKSLNDYREILKTRVGEVWASKLKKGYAGKVDTANTSKLLPNTGGNSKLHH